MDRIVIVGGGLCGLALARSLQSQGRPFAVYEARDRLGGRILSDAATGFDLGPSWFWPESQKLIAALLGELGLEDFSQADDGTALLLRDPDKKPEQMHGAPVHGGARRVAGGMGRLVTALADGLPPQSLHLGHVLMGVQDGGDHVRLAFRQGERLVDVAARQVVLAMPPRLVAARIGFTPGLEADVQAALQGTTTWMAARAKVVIGYARPAWREAGQSGNAFVSHEQAVIGEIFEAGDAALGGFLALAPDLREAFSVGLPLLWKARWCRFLARHWGRGTSIIMTGRRNLSPVLPGTARRRRGSRRNLAIRCCAGRCGAASSILAVRRPGRMRRGIWRARWTRHGGSSDG